MERTRIPLRTSIGLGLKVIPPSAGLARSPRLTQVLHTVGHHIRKAKKSSYVSPLVMTVEKDTVLEEEIRDYIQGLKKE